MLKACATGKHEAWLLSIGDVQMAVYDLIPRTGPAFHCGPLLIGTQMTSGVSSQRLGSGSEGDSARVAGLVTSVAGPSAFSGGFADPRRMVDTWVVLR
jgi:hypothetical protein